MPQGRLTPDPKAELITNHLKCLNVPLVHVQVLQWNNVCSTEALGDRIAGMRGVGGQGGLNLLLPIS